MAANVLHFASPYRIDQSFNRDQIAKRNDAAFANGDRRRRHDTAHQLQQLAAEIKGGKHGELVLSMASRLLALRGAR